MTENMQKFIAINSHSKVISGGHINSEGLPINKLNESIGVEYIFQNRHKILLTEEDVRSAPSFSPIWKI